ncbi:MAG: hypothetical protein ACRELC_12870, partial [Gemmatimonadota bacterium]
MRAAASLALGSLVVSTQPARAQGSEAPGDVPAVRAAATLAIVGGTLIDGNEGPPLRNAVILVEGERITHVGTVDDTEIPAGAEVIDANGRTVMP